MSPVVDDPRVGGVHICHPGVFGDRALKVVTAVDLVAWRCAGCAQMLMGQQILRREGHGLSLGDLRHRCTHLPCQGRVGLELTGCVRQTGSTTLTFVERDNQGTFRFIDVRPKSTRRGEPSVSAGDSFYGSSPLYNAANTRRRGKLFFKCTAVTGSKRFAGSTFLCDATAKLSNGTLAVSVLFKGRNPGGPVIGGTGAYEGASGSLTSDERRRTSVDTLHFDTD